MKRIEGLVLAAEDINTICKELVCEMDDLNGRVTQQEKIMMNLLQALKNAT